MKLYSCLGDVAIPGKDFLDMGMKDLARVSFNSVLGVCDRAMTVYTATMQCRCSCCCTCSATYVIADVNVMMLQNVL